jgi:signal transduction histidine kinase
MVTATLETEGAFILLRVSDTGVGVPLKIRDSLFDPFVSAGKQKGSGLGLTIASAISVEHGGQVVLVRSRPGETVFQMRIPREAIENGTSGTGSVKDGSEVTTG